MNKTEKEKAKNTIGKIVGYVSVIVLVLCLILLITVTTTISRGKVFRLFGYSFHIVITDSMTPTIKVGDLVVAKYTDKEDIVVGDAIVFVSKDPTLRGNQVVHRVYDIDENGDFITRGDKAGAPIDEYHVSEVIGRVTAVNTAIGKFISFLITYRKWVLLVLILIIVVVAILEGCSIFLAARKKGEPSKDALIDEEAKKEIAEKLRKEILEELKRNDAAKNDDEVKK